MRKSLYSFVICIAIILVSVGSVMAESYNLDGTGNYVGDRYVVNCNEWVSLRYYPDTSSDRLAKVPLGAKVNDCFEADNGFFFCEYNGTTGYIQRKYLSSNPPTSNTTISNTSSDDRFDLNQFDYRTVVERGRGKLVFQSSPGGSFMNEYKFYDGDEIYVNLNWRKSGYAIAYKNGQYGYVDASYIDWTPLADPEPDPMTGSFPGKSSNSSKSDLSNFDWRRVDSNGRGSLVFQYEPRGKSMKGHKFYDGDWIFVNIYYRENGYGYAYEDNEYGYVDASYIDW